MSESDPRHSALFAQLVLQQANMALMLLGKVPHPETGQTVKDLEAAGFFIDVIEMLEVKTRGNLSKDESDMLRQSLMNLRMAFVEASGDQTPAPEPVTEPKPAPAASEGAPATPSASEAESRTKFSKKY